MCKLNQIVGKSISIRIITLISFISAFFLSAPFYSYFSCGNQVFKIDASGNLVWKSPVFNATMGYTFDYDWKIPPSIHYEKDLVFFFHSNCSVVYVLSVKDGGVQYFYTTPPSSYYTLCYHAPIILGSSVLYIVKVDASYFDHILYSIAINV